MNHHPNVSGVITSGPEISSLSNPLVVFDFDGTLYSEDSFAQFIRWRIFSSRWRTLLAVLALPIVAFIRHLPDGRRHYASVFLWIASLGCDLHQLEEQMAVYVYRQALKAHGRFYTDAVAQLKKHQQLGHQVVVATGAAESLVQLFLQSQRISNVLIVGSRLAEGWGGVLCRFHCYHYRKQQALSAIFPGQRYSVVYSDSLVDLPILSQADHAVLINAEPQQQQQLYVHLSKSNQQNHSVYSLSWV